LIGIGRKSLNLYTPLVFNANVGEGDPVGILQRC